MNTIDWIAAGVITGTIEIYSLYPYMVIYYPEHSRHTTALPMYTRGTICSVCGCFLLCWFEKLVTRLERQWADCNQREPHTGRVHNMQHVRGRLSFFLFFFWPKFSHNGSAVEISLSCLSSCQLNLGLHWLVCAPMPAGFLNSYHTERSCVAVVLHHTIQILDQFSGVGLLPRQTTGCCWNENDCLGKYGRLRQPILVFRNFRGCFPCSMVVCEDRSVLADYGPPVRVEGS